MADVLAAPQHAQTAKADSEFRTLGLISVAHWVSHFHLLVLPMLFPFLKAQLGVGYIELGFALTTFAVLLGIANSVYHPADYAILSEHMNDARMGRAFSIHTFAGFLGGAVAPAVVAALAATIGGHGALIATGAIGPLVALLLIVVGIPDAGAAQREAK